VSRQYTPGPVLTLLGSSGIVSITGARKTTRFAVLSRKESYEA
jgi:hypothetical protein